MPIKTHIFLTGATGYIGGSVLTRLLTHPLSPTFRITILIRDASKAAKFRTMGIRAVEGSLSNHDLVKELATDADVVFSCADVYDQEAARAILDGLQDRRDNTNKISSIIHTTGLAAFVDNSYGMLPCDAIFSDLDLRTFGYLPDAEADRSVVMMLYEAELNRYANTYKVIPAMIYGKATGPLVDAGLQNPYSQLILRLVEVAFDRGGAGMVGAGINTYHSVHIGDVADLYILLLDLILNHNDEEDIYRPPPISPEEVKADAFRHGDHGWYFAENGKHTQYQLAEGIGKALVEFKVTKDETPTRFSEAELMKYFPDDPDGSKLGSNMRIRSDRSRRIGWKPKKGTSDMLTSIIREVERKVSVSVSDS